MTYTWSNRPDDPGRRYEWEQMMRTSKPLGRIATMVSADTSAPMRRVAVGVVGPIRSTPVGERKS